MCHSNIMFHMHRAIKQMADVWNAKCQQRAICIATTGRGKGALLMHYLCYARWLCTNFVPQGIRRLLLICPLGKAINQSCRGNAGWTTYKSFQTKIPEFWMKLLWHTHISNMYIVFCWELCPSSLFTTRVDLYDKNENEPLHTKDQQKVSRDDMFDAKNKRGPTWPYMVRQTRPLHYDCGFPLLAGNLPPFHHPHFPPVPFRIPPFCFPSKYIHIIHGTHVHPWGTITSEDALQSIYCGKSAWDSSDSFWAKRKLKVSREHITFCSLLQLELNWFREMGLSKTKNEIWSECKIPF